MPRLPDYTDLGQRPIPQSRRDLARNPHAGAVGEALAGLGEAVGEVARRLPLKPDRAALASDAALNSIHDMLKKAGKISSISWFTREQYESGAEVGKPIP
jgi:hypothetical protein